MLLNMQFVNSQPTPGDEEHSDLGTSASSVDRSLVSVSSKRIKEHSDLDSNVSSDDRSFTSIGSKRTKTVDSRKQQLRLVLNVHRYFSLK